MSSLARPGTAAASSVRAQRTVAHAAVVLVALFAAAAVAGEPWSLDARAFHADGFAAGVTTQSLAGGGLAPDPLAPDAGTVAYVVHTKGQDWAALVVYDPATVRYRQVCGLVGPFENANDIETFDPLLRSVLRTVHDRGFPTRLRDYTADVRTMDATQYDGAPTPRAAPDLTATLAPASGAPESPTARTPLTARETAVLLGGGAVALVLVALSSALLLHLFFRHREQMAVVRTATRAAPSVAAPPAPTVATRPAPTATRKAPPTPRPTAVPAPPPAAKQQT